MKESILALLAGWLAAYQIEPLYTALAGVGGGLGAVAVLSRAMAARIQARSHLAGRPVLVLSGAVAAAVCMLWAATDAALAWRGQPLLGERLLALLLPSALPAGMGMEVLRTLLGLPADGALRLPPAISMPLGLVAATALHLAIAAMLGSALAELVALQSRPDDVLLRERMRAARASRAREEAQGEPADGQPADGQEGRAAPAGHAPGAEAGAPGEAAGADRAPASTPGDERAPAWLPEEEAHASASVLLPDSGLGRLYKLLGHWDDLLYVEPRFLRWYEPLTRSAHGLVLAGALPCALGYLPVPAWVGAVVLAIALRIPARSRPARAPVPVAAGAAAGEDAAAEPAPSFVHDPQIAPHLAPVAAPAWLAAPVPSSRRAPAGPARGASRVMGEVLGVLGVSALHEHQARAAQAFLARRSVLLCTPPGSGRALVTDALVLQAVLADAERVLYLAPDAERARAARARFEARAEASHWKWNVPAADLTRPPGAAAAGSSGPATPGDTQPALIFADPAAVHRALCRRQDRWQAFLAGLGAVVLVDLHAHGGVRAAHLAHLLRRLYRAAHRARTATAGGRLLAGDDVAGLDVRVLATAEPGAADLLRFAQRITGCAFERIGPEHDTAPRPAQSAHVVLADPGRAASGAGAIGPGAAGALALRDAARARGLRAELDGYDRALSAAERDPRGELAHAQVIVARLAPDRQGALPGLVRHLGTPGRHPVAVLWQPDPEPLAGRMARDLIAPGDTAGQADDGLPGLSSGPRLVVWPGAAEVERGHLLCTLAEGDVATEELEQAFSRDLVHAELAALRAQGRVVEREQRLLVAHQGGIRTTPTVRLAGGDDVHDRVDLAVCGEPWHLVERTTGAVVRSLEGARAMAAAYPRRVLIAGGRRLVVLDHEAQEQRARRRILCEPGDEMVVTVPVRRFDIHAVERRGRGPGGAPAHAPHPEDPREHTQDGAERRRGGLRSVGGEAFSLQHRDADIDERVLGVRRFDLGGRALDSTAYDEPVRCRFRSRVAVIGVPSRALAPETLHALVHGFRICLPALLRHDEDDLDVVALPGHGAVAFVDLHPGGAGFADALELDVIRNLLRATLFLVRGCPAACASGCPACLHTWTCRAPAEQYQRVDRAGADALLAALLGMS